MMTMIVFNKQ